MKNVFKTLAIALVATVFTSCGSGEKTACDCITTSVEMMKEAKGAEGDEAKQKEIETKYKADVEACEKMGKDMEKEMEGKTDEEKAAKQAEMEKEMEDCPAMKEMEELMKEMMGSMGQ